MLLGIDFGTTHTVAVLHPQDGDGRVVPLLFDASPLLLSAVHLAPDGQLLTGRDAARGALQDPARSEPNPKLRIDDGTVLLGDTELPVQSLIAAPLRRALTEATRHLGAPPAATVLTYPASWAARRRDVLLRAAEEAGLPGVTLTPEPVAAAAFHSRTSGETLPAGAFIVVYDLGGGTFDVTVLRRGTGGWQVAGSAGLDDVGGIDFDAALVEHVGRTAGARDPRRWRRLLEPADPAGRRVLQSFRDDVRGAKEQLSRTTSATVRVPGLEVEAYLSRDELDAVVAPLLERTVDLVDAVLGRAGVPARDLAAVYLVGGSSRIPLAATMLHRRFGVPPTLVDQPELVVASGSAAAAHLSTPAGPSTDPALSGAPVSGLPVSGLPVSGLPVSGVPSIGSPVSGSPFIGSPVSGSPVSGSPSSGPAVSVPAPAARGGLSRRRRAVAAGVVVLLLAGLFVWGPWRPRPRTVPGAGPAGSSTQVGGAGNAAKRTVHIGKTAWYAGFSLKFDDAVYDPAGAQLLVTLEATNTGPADTALLDTEFPVSVSFAGRRVKGSYTGASITVPHAGTSPATLKFDLPGPADPATGVLHVGTDDLLGAVVPFTGTDGQTLLEPTRVLGPVTADVRLLHFTGLTCTLRADRVRLYRQAKEGDRVLGCDFDVALNGVSNGIIVNADMFRLVLPDGTERSPADVPNESVNSNGEQTGMYVYFEVKDPAPGPYKLRLRYRDLFDKYANTDKDVPFTVPPH